MAKKPAAPKPRKPKPPKQPFLDGMEPLTIKEIDESAERLSDARAQRMAYLDVEIKEADVLLLLMHKHKLKVYEYDGKRVEISALEKVKVKKQKDDSAESNGESVEE